MLKELKNLEHTLEFRKTGGISTVEDKKSNVFSSLITNICSKARYLYK